MRDVDKPPRIARLPVNEAGYAVPWFVAWIKGVPDFRVIGPGKLRTALDEGRCWICGERMKGPTTAFLIGPMCAVNRNTAEPGSHRECAVYAAMVCPFLVNPRKRRREGNKPAHVEPAGHMIERNPGVALVWVTRSFQPYRDERGGQLIRLGEPTRLLWFAEGRVATRAEVLHSIETGLPLLADMAVRESPEAVVELDRLVRDALQLVDSTTSDHELPPDVDCYTLPNGECIASPCRLHDP